MLCVTGLLCLAGLGVEMEWWAGKEGVGCSSGSAGVQGPRVAAHGALRGLWGWC